MILRDSRSLVLLAAPTEPTELRTIFSDDPAGIKSRLENPPDLRPGSGWGLTTRDRARFVRGEFIRVQTFREVIDLYRDGFLLLGALINHNFLAWADRDESTRIHPLALIELTVNFTRFYERVLDDFRARPTEVELRIMARNMHQHGKTTGLPAGALNNAGWSIGRLEAPQPEWGKNLIVRSDTYKSEVVAFQLLREFYVWFGHSEDDIPYTRVDGPTKSIDLDAILSLR